MIYSRFSLVIYFIHCINHVLCEPSELLWRVWGLIQNAILPLLPSSWGFSFALGRGVSFFGGIQHSPVNGCSVASCNFGVLAGEDECMSFYSSICDIIQESAEASGGPSQGPDGMSCLQRAGPRALVGSSSDAIFWAIMYMCQ